MTDGKAQHLQDQVVDAKIEAGVAKAEATAHAADTNSLVSKADIQRMQVQLAQKGIKITLD